MKTYRYTYNILETADNETFMKTCQRIENAGIAGIEKKKLLADVDGSLIQIYQVPDGEIKIQNDYEVDAVYADSDVDLSALFPNGMKIEQNGQGMVIFYDKK